MADRVNEFDENRLHSIYSWNEENIWYSAVADAKALKEGLTLKSGWKYSTTNPRLRLYEIEEISWGLIKCNINMIS